jgi:hypothetical protein
MRKHVKLAVSGCGADVAEGTSPRARLCSTVTGYLYWKAEEWSKVGHAAIHPLDLYRLGELVRWHIDSANVEPTGEEVDQQVDSSLPRDRQWWKGWTPTARSLTNRRSRR